MVKTGNVLAVVGGQFGSEGKGVIVARIADWYDVHVRTGGANAGHSFWHDNQKWVSQMIPVGWINPQAKLVLGRGAMLDLAVLDREIAAIRATYGDNFLDGRLLIDMDAFLVEEQHHLLEGGVRGELHQRIGSTGEGIGAARVARLQRDGQYIRRIKEIQVDEMLLKYPNVWAAATIVSDTPGYLSSVRKAGKNILLEGTQGCGLSLIHGFWPYVTSADTNAAQLAVDAGIPPQHVNQVLLVCRTYPIRVAGNSGPLWKELSWETMSERVGREVQEKTTVTKKVRRIGEWDSNLFRRAVTLNAPTALALTFVDYLSPAALGKSDYLDMDRIVTDFVRDIEFLADCPVALLGTGPNAEGAWQTVWRGYNMSGELTW